MPEKPVSVKPSGSFVSSNAIKESIEAKRAADEINKSQDSVEKEKLEAAEKERVKEIDALLPSMVLSSYGEITYTTFKHAYKQIWDQIKEKEHLALGYCHFSGELLPGVQGTIRTLRSRENRAVLRWAPSFDASGMMRDAQEDIVFRHIKLVIGLTSFDGHQMTEMPELLTDKADEWRKLALIEQKMGWLDSLPEEVTMQLSGLQLDISNAVRFALRENLKNRLAPPAHS